MGFVNYRKSKSVANIILNEEDFAVLKKDKEILVKDQKHNLVFHFLIDSYPSSNAFISEPPCQDFSLCLDEKEFMHLENYQTLSQKPLPLIIFQGMTDKYIFEMMCVDKTNLETPKVVEHNVGKAYIHFS